MTAVLINDTIYIFGGYKIFNKQIKRRECYKDLITYNAKTNQWKIIESTSVESV